ncbi:MULTISPECIES: Na+/H+ antiporter subunit E [unclassified Pseudomonas]|uniref:Na+/H+ antiporter subunit E n=1 Tax=unclassified Pseudomonas TaxID=196821 RepID=UPI000BD21DF2|nr:MULTISPECIES: Na+/H+ antiporter subunit E [unclassified Pseudomonas]PVZ13485.1 multicomponent K+:H+ antiporter subunit E [Pseudomonas sp. URIL14HWK12:I12]PVZ23791.1 multicomponent K+:H+ antiporter subunit E [Pseudomonas sp. URIL14HWK12:I10]PVZ33570.1 multicomponent K+:H+ antiporter subunit E [Pseudomonas sp. URIL14HWK12:I11]SNZ12052.1 multisubunit potassium/proton antiporter, PhaE subunit (TC 2.A.63.1.1) [Pseudomonas sp. URIL14HWK12:I9]
MKRVLPHPGLSLSLSALWLLLNGSLSAGHLLLAALLGLAVPLLVADLRPGSGRAARPAVTVRLVARVMTDLLHSNLQVAVQVLRRRPPASAWVEVPLQLRSPQGLAVLAVISCAVPGTVWCKLSRERDHLLIHVLSLDDEKRFITDFKAHYEQPLLEIFP